MTLRIMGGQYAVSPVIVFLCVFIVSLLVALVLTPWAQRIGHRRGLVAVPGGRRKHQGIVPRRIVGLIFHGVTRRISDKIPN